jgi:hypothetical protein
MRNIKRVILWGLPPSFCALVQRAGRAARDFKMLGEAILIVPPTVLSKGITEAEVESALTINIADESTEAENRGEEETETLASNGIQLASGNEMVYVDDGGVRVAHDSDDEGDAEVKEVKKNKKKKVAKDFNSREAKFLSLFVGTTKCRRLVWDEFFDNQTKCKCLDSRSINLVSLTCVIYTVQLIYPTNTSYQELPGTRCCDNCTPRLFEVELIKLQSLPALKRGKKRKLPEATENAIRDSLRTWRDEELLNKFYPGTSIMSGATLFGDDLVEKLALCGERVDSAAILARHIRWPIGIDAETHVLTPYGNELLAVLHKIYSMIDDQAAAEVARIQHLRSLPEEVSPADFYQGPSTSGQRTGHSVSNDESVSTANTDADEDTNYPNVPQAREHSRGRGRRGRGVGTRRVTTRGRGRGRGRPRAQNRG